MLGALTSLIAPNLPTPQLFHIRTFRLAFHSSFFSAQTGSGGDAGFGAVGGLVDEVDQALYCIFAVGILGAVFVGGEDDDAVFGEF